MIEHSATVGLPNDWIWTAFMITGGNSGIGLATAKQL
jgi:NADP-dependent 3-hydroxy acid dehydrogenase YdfG